MTIRQINDIIEEAQGLKTITQAYSEIASIRLKKIRKQVEGTRQFFDEVAKLYGLIRVLGRALPSAPKKGTISLLLTSNLRFNGRLNDMVTKFFIAQTQRYKTDRVVVGKLVSQTLKGFRYPYQFTTFVFKRDQPESNELQQLANSIKDYQQILVFYTKFATVLKQVPFIDDITQIQAASLKRAVDLKNKTLMIVEPEIAKMMQFFDSQIKMSLLQQTFLEAELSRLSSRLINMDEAQQRAVDFLDAQKLVLLTARRAYENKKILEMWNSTLPSRSLV